MEERAAAWTAGMVQTQYQQCLNYIKSALIITETFQEVMGPLDDDRDR